MPASRIFVSYACLGDEPGATIAKKLVNDIRATQTEVVTDHETISDERFIEFLNRELPQCAYLIVIETPIAWQSLRVQVAVHMALNLVAQQRMRGILRVLALPSQHVGNHSLWDSLYTFDASRDYLRARDKVFIELGLISLDADDSFYISRPLPLPQPPPTPGGLLPQQPSGPVPSSTAIPRPLQPSGPIPNFTTPQPSQLSRPVPNFTTPQPSQPSGPISQPMRGSWVQPPSGSAPSPASTMPWPPQPSNPGAPGQLPLAPQKKNWSILVASKNVWLQTSAQLRRLWKISQTRLAAQQSNKAAPLGIDRPMPLRPAARQVYIRWAIVIGIVLILTLVSILLIASLHRA